MDFLPFSQHNIYHSTSLPKMLSVECDPFKNIREISPVGHWYLGIRKVKNSFERHRKKLNRLSLALLQQVVPGEA